MKPDAGAPTHRRLFPPALAAAGLLIPHAAHADDFAGLGVIVAGMFVALPGLVITIGLIIASIVLGAKKDVRPGRRRYAWTAIVVSLLPVLAFPVASILLSDGAHVGNETALLTAALALPCLRRVVTLAGYSATGASVWQVGTMMKDETYDGANLLQATTYEYRKREVLPQTDDIEAGPWPARQHPRARAVEDDLLSQ